MFIWFCILIKWFDSLYGTYLPLDLSIPDKVISTFFLALGSLVLSGMVCPSVVLFRMSSGHSAGVSSVHLQHLPRLMGVCSSICAKSEKKLETLPSSS